MSLMEKISRKIEQIEEGNVFTYSDFNVTDDKVGVLAKSLSRLRQKGIIERISKGSYYKPKQTQFGKLQPSEDQLLQVITKRNEVYPTGNIIYNKLGLTTQVPNEYVFACNKEKKPVKVGSITIRFVKREDINNKNIDKHQILDAICNIKKIPDSDINSAFETLFNKVRKLRRQERKILAKLALNYNPATRALTGAMLEKMKEKELAIKLNKSLNKLSKYKIGISEVVLPNKDNWNII